MESTCVISGNLSENWLFATDIEQHFWIICKSQQKVIWCLPHISTKANTKVILIYILIHIHLDTYSSFWILFKINKFSFETKFIYKWLRHKQPYVLQLHVFLQVEFQIVGRRSSIKKKHNMKNHSFLQYSSGHCMKINMDVPIMRRGRNRISVWNPIHTVIHISFNSLKPSDAICVNKQTSLVQIMACRLSGAQPF